MEPNDGPRQDQVVVTGRRRQGECGQAVSEDEIRESRPLSIRETAKLMRRRELSVIELIETGKLPFIQRGRSRYVLPEDARMFLKGEAQIRQPRRRRRVRTKITNPEYADWFD